MREATRAPAGEPDSVSGSSGRRGAKPGGPRRSGNGAASGPGIELSLDAVSHAFGPTVALDRLQLRARPREVVALVGPSGCGKSTLLELVAGLREPDQGEIAVEGRSEPVERLRRCAYMPQRDLLFPWLAAIDSASLALRNRGVARREARAEAAELFERFGLGGFELARPAELSGGMRQRVAFLRTLLARKPVLLLDEPFGALDAITRAEMQAWLAEALAVEPRTVILVSHDVEEALYLADRVAVLSPRPGHVLRELAYERPRGSRTKAVADPRFAELRHEAMTTLLEGNR